MLRIFPNEAGKFDRSLQDVSGQALVVSQFTLFADTSKGRRPSFSDAAPPAKAIPLYERVVSRLIEAGVRATQGRRAPSYVGSGEGPGDLGINAEKYLRELADESEHAQGR